MVNKTFKEEAIEEYRNDYKEIDSPSTQARMERVIEITLDKYKERILEALPKEDNPEYGGIINFASNVNPDDSQDKRQISSFNYGFRLGYKISEDEFKQIIENI